MKTAELKLDDWILCQDKPVKVKGVEQHILFYTVEKDGRTVVSYTTSNQIKPIPLTTEILEKNGWEKNSYAEGMYHKDPFTLKQCGKRWSFVIYDDISCVISSVHQLQHILWAFGMDDNLKI